jgi:hypothetical protein
LIKHAALAASGPSAVEILSSSKLKDFDGINGLPGGGNGAVRKAELAAFGGVQHWKITSNLLEKV